MSNFHPLEVVARGSETQLQVGEKITLRTMVEDETYPGYLVRLKDDLCDTSFVFHPLQVVDRINHHAHLHSFYQPYLSGIFVRNTFAL